MCIEEIPVYQSWERNLFLFLEKQNGIEQSEHKNIIWCREMLVTEAYKAKERTVQRPQAWGTVADNLNKIPFPALKADN